MCILKFFEKKFSIFNNSSFSFVGYVFLLSLILNNLINYINFKSGNEILHSPREDFSKLVKFINNDKFLNNKKTQILTLDAYVFTILHLKDFNNFTIIPNSFWTVRPISMIEQNLYKSFKNLGYDDNTFINVFKNDELNYRITGKVTNDYFGLIYLANKNIKYSQYEDYLENEKKIIKSTSPFRTQQFIVPQSEYKRLRENYNKFKQNLNDIGFIIIDKNDEITKKYNIDENKYCKIYANESYVVYKNKLYCE